jgi:pimeloyl-ACP methyl ester carboxylesterase
MPHIRVNGATLHYELRGKGPPLVLLHGLQGDSTTFGNLPEALAERCTVLTFDQRGSGQSEKTATAISTADLADDTAELMARLNLASAAVFGTSMGGQIAQQLALRQPKRVERLVLGCTTPGGGAATPVNTAAMDYAYTLEPLSAEERARRLAEVAFSPQWLSAHPEAIEFLVAARRQRPLDLRALARRREAFTAHDTYDRLSAIQQPTLILTGTPDGLIPEANSHLLAHHLPNAILRIIEPAGHLFWIERPKETLDAINSFLAPD